MYQQTMELGRQGQKISRLMFYFLLAGYELPITGVDTIYSCFYTEQTIAERRERALTFTRKEIIGSEYVVATRLLTGA